MNDTITIKIKCSSETCESLREDGLFFETIAEVLDIDRDDIEEVDEVVDAEGQNVILLV